MFYLCYELKKRTKVRNFFHIKDIYMKKIPYLSEK